MIIENQQNNQTAQAYLDHTPKQEHEVNPQSPIPIKKPFFSHKVGYKCLIPFF